MSNPGRNRSKPQLRSTGFASFDRFFSTRVTNPGRNRSKPQLSSTGVASFDRGFSSGERFDRNRCTTSILVRALPRAAGDRALVVAPPVAAPWPAPAPIPAGGAAACGEAKEGPRLDAGVVALQMISIRICLSIYLSIHLCVSIYVYRYLSLPIYLSIHLSIYLG